MPKVLYLPIMEPGSYHERSLQHKHGLYDAFRAVGECLQWDYCATPHEALLTTFRRHIEEFQPTLIFTQFQGTATISPDDMRMLRAEYGVPVVNWNGDYSREALTSPGMLALLKEVDLQLVADAAVLPVYESEGIRAAYFPVAFEPPHDPLPDVPEYDVLYLGNNYSAFRRGLYDVLRSLPCKVGIYGNGWPQNEGECTYDFTTGHALYKRAKIAIADNQYADAIGSMSTRTLQAFGAGCFTLHQKVADLEKLTGFKPGRHYVSFDTIDQLPDLVAYWLDSWREARREIMGLSARFLVYDKHTWNARVDQLFGELMPETVGDKA